MDRIEFIVSSLNLPDPYSFLNLALLRRSSWKAIALFAALLLIGGSVPRSIPTRAHIIKSAVALPDFNFFEWGDSVSNCLSVDLFFPLSDQKYFLCVAFRDRQFSV